MENFKKQLGRGTWWCLLVLGMLWCRVAQAQLDPEERRLLQLGFNQPLQGRGPIAAYGFFYYNQPNFMATNVTLRFALAPIYLDSELGFKGLIGPNTDVGLGVAGGGFAETYSEIRGGKYWREETFVGHGGEVSANLYHRLNPRQEIPLSLVFKAAVHESFYETDSDTAANFQIPDDRTSFIVRTGLRFGGMEPSLTEPLAMELSIWHAGYFRANSDTYGFAGDREIESQSHQFWTRALLKYIFDQSEQVVEVSMTAGTTVEADRFSAFRLGGSLPFSSEFPLNIPGYYFQELSARRFALLNAEYSFPFTPSKNWRLAVMGATGPVDYLEGLEQPGHWHTGAGAGFSYISPSGSWLVTLVYGHGFDAIRTSGRGADQVGFVFQYDFEAKKKGKNRWFQPGVNPYQSRGGERIFR